MIDGRRPIPEPPDRAFLVAETQRLLAFGERSVDEGGGFASLDTDGRQVDGPVRAYITARMTHIFAIGQLLGYETASLVDHGIRALEGRLRDETDGGWYTSVARDGTSPTDKQAYDLVHVILGASSAVHARHPLARGLLDDALTVLDDRFWDDGAGAIVDTWSRGWRVLDPYRGANANMHAVEALLAAADAIGSPARRDQAARILDRFVNHAARENEWRMPEHYSAAWEPDRSYNRDRPSDMFKPYGVTLGHLFEWAKLCCQARAALGSSSPAWLLPAARDLFSRAVADGWSVDGAAGFVYTVDWDGMPKSRQRLHWVLAEAISAATILAQVTGEAAYADWYRTWWRYAEAFVIDREAGSWHNELDPGNRPAATIVSGKPDIYHSVQACLLPLVEPAGSLAAALVGAAANGKPSVTAGGDPIPGTA